MLERYINNLMGDFSICFSEHLTGHPNYLGYLPMECLCFGATCMVLWHGKSGSSFQTSAEKSSHDTNDEPARRSDSLRL